MRDQTKQEMNEAQSAEGEGFAGRVCSAVRKCKYRSDYRRAIVSSGARPELDWKEAIFHGFTSLGEAIIECDGGIIDVITIARDNGYGDRGCEFILLPNTKATHTGPVSGETL